MAHIDPIFLFVSNENQAKQHLDEIGLDAHLSRQHPGQGTTNLCSFFKNAFLEFLWLDGSEISEESKRINLEQRGLGKGHRLGLSWAGDVDIDKELYFPPYLPKTKPIHVYKQSLDADFPFLFETPQVFDPKRFFEAPDLIENLPTLKKVRLFSHQPQRLKTISDVIEGIEIVDGKNRIEVDLSLADNRKRTLKFDFPLKSS